MNQDLLTVEQTKSLDQAIVAIAELEALTESFAEFFNLDGRKIEEIAKNYSKRKYDAKVLLNRVKLNIEEVQTVLSCLEGKYWFFYNEKHPRELSTKDIQMYIAAVPEVVSVRQILVNLNFVKGKYESILDALDSMNWMISNIVKLRVEQLKDEIL